MKHPQSGVNLRRISAKKRLELSLALANKDLKSLQELPADKQEPNFLDVYVKLEREIVRVKNEINTLNSRIISLDTMIESKVKPKRS